MSSFVGGGAPAIRDSSNRSGFVPTAMLFRAFRFHRGIRVSKTKNTRVVVGFAHPWGVRGFSPELCLRKVRSAFAHKVLNNSESTSRLCCGGNTRLRSLMLLDFPCGSRGWFRAECSQVRHAAAGATLVVYLDKKMYTIKNINPASLRAYFLL